MPSKYRVGPTRVVTIRYPHDTIRIAILAENCKMDQQHCQQWQLKLNVQAAAFFDIYFPSNGLLFALFIDTIIAKKMSGYRQSMHYM